MPTPQETLQAAVDAYTRAVSPTPYALPIPDATARIKAVQAKLGVPAGGNFGPLTLAAIERLLGIGTPPTPEPTPTPPPAAADPVDELFGCVYGGRPDLTGSTVPNRAGSEFAAHDGGRLPGFSAGQVDWSDGATKQAWPPRPGGYINAWNHAFIRSQERRCYVDFSDPAIYLYDGNAWHLAPYPSGDSSLWASWIAPVFTFLSAPVVRGRATTPGGTPYSWIDLSASTANNQWFVHSAWNRYFPRLPIGSAQAVSLQFWARLRPKTGVDPTTLDVVAGGGSDWYNSATDPGGGANPALGIPRYKRLPTDSSWRLMGYTSLPPAVLLSDPPPVLPLPV